jgi:glucose dehydrogenase
VGYVDPDTKDVEFIKLDGEEIQNSLAISEDGVYIVSDHAMYRFDVSADGTPYYTWRTVYDRGSSTKPGAINQGSGTTPSLLDVPCSNGSTRKLVGITDNADDRVNLVVYDRLTGEAIVTEPLFESGHSVSENSLIAHGRSFIVENNYSDSGAGFLEGNPTSYPGITRFDMNDDCTDAFIAWESDEASCTVVPKLSTKNGLVYLYTREYGNGIPENAVAWYFTAVDFETGETVYKVLTGTGRNWNNSYGPITIGPNGSAYVGVFNGLVSITDKN